MLDLTGGFFLVIIILILIIFILYIFTINDNNNNINNNDNQKLWIPEMLATPSKNTDVDREFDLIIKNQEIDQQKKSRIMKSRGFHIITNLIGHNHYAIFADKKSYIIRRNINIDPFTDTDAWSNRNRKLILQDHYPYYQDHGIILSTKYFDMLIVDNYLINLDIGFSEPRIIVPITQGKVHQPTSMDKIIPKIIHQSFSGRLLPKCYGEAIKTWIKLNKDYEYRYYDDTDMRRMIIENRKILPIGILEAYDKLIPGAFKGDLWRLVVIYLYGGFYADVKSGCLVNLEEIRTQKPSIFVYDCCEVGIYNAFFASYPKNPLLFQLMIQTINNVNEEYYGDHCISVTGPIMIGNYFIVNKIMPIETFFYRGKHSFNDQGNKDILMLFHINENIHLYETICNNKKKPITNTRANTELYNYRLAHVVSGLDHYGVLWRNRKIYNTDHINIDNYKFLQRINTPPDSIFYSFLLDDKKRHWVGWGRQKYDENQSQAVQLDFNFKLTSLIADNITAEDPRILSHHGHTYVVDNTHNHIRLYDTDEKKYYDIDLPGENFTFLSYRDKLYMIYNMIPFSMYQITLGEKVIINKYPISDNQNIQSTEIYYRGGTPGYASDHNPHFYYGFGHKTYTTDDILMHDPYLWTFNFITKQFNIIDLPKPKNCLNITDPTCVISHEGKKYLITAESDKPWFVNQDYVTNIYEILSS